MLKNILATLILCLGLAHASPQSRITVAPPLQALLAKDSAALLPLLDSQFNSKEYQTLTLQLINYYPLVKDQYWLSVACHDSTRLVRIMSFIAHRENPAPILTSPVLYLTRHWQHRRIGNITYHYPDSINLTRARKFNEKNTTIARKLGLAPEKLDFYLTENYQQNLALQGYTYDAASAGRTRDGSGDNEHRIFSIMHNEDFSHDITHYYVARVRTNSRNSAAEEGLAYYWANAYYTDTTGGMIDYPAQLNALNNYLHDHPDSTLLSLFEHNIKPFSYLAPEVSIRSILAARICQYLEETLGTAGIKTLINCGRGDDNYFNTLDSLTGINRSNFDTRMHALLAH